MKAVQFIGSIPRYMYSKALGGLRRAAYYDRFSNIVLRDVEPPRLPSSEWVRIKTRYAGICGSDKNLVLLHDSPSASPFSSFPFTIGHEVVGELVEVGDAARDLSEIAIGSRVIVDPILGCVPRQIVPVCPECERGEYRLCSNFTGGIVAPGLAIGSCRDTGGGWSEELVAHASQVIPLPDCVSSEDAVVIDAFCSALHPVMSVFPGDQDSVVIIGCGIVGLSAVAALRALGSKANMVCLAKYGFQGEAAESLGADKVFYTRDDYYAEMAKYLGARILKPMMGKRVIQGGADIVFDCVGSSTSIDDALRFTRPKGTMVLVGLAAFPKGVDWTPVWLSEVNIRGSFWCDTQDYNGKRMRAYDIALDLLAKGAISLAPLLTHKYSLSDYRKALEDTMTVGRSKLIKSAFVFR